MTLVYIKGPVPDALEQKVIDSSESPSVRNAGRWKGELESCELVVSSVDEILEAYKAKGIETQKIAPKAVRKPAAKKAAPKAK